MTYINKGVNISLKEQERLRQSGFAWLLNLQRKGFEIVRVSDYLYYLKVSSVDTKFTV